MRQKKQRQQCETEMIRNTYRDSSLVNTWHPNFDRVPLPVWSSFRVPLEIISSTNLRYIYPLCFSKINFGRQEKFSKLVEFRLPLDFAALLSK